ncbi:MAG: ankyrin repeat domain-containing protein [Francisellaceae bacterium]|nr:ankyrin repeat domain-containing protein [Francisellaceae bacterium]
MPYISSDKFRSPILKKIADGDESVFFDALDDELNMTEEDLWFLGVFRPLPLACNNGHIDVVNRLLEMPQVLGNATDNDNYALWRSAQNGHLCIVNRLLEIPQVLANATAVNNGALRFAAEYGHLNVVDRLLEIPQVQNNVSAMRSYPFCAAAENGHISVVNRLLEIPDVLANASINHNYPLRAASLKGHLDVVNRLLEIPTVVANTVINIGALRMAVQNGHNEISYILARLQWPRGVVDLPNDLHEYLPEIYQGAVIASGKKEFEGMVKCWIRGKPAISASDIHYPGHGNPSQNLIRIDGYNAPRTIIQYAGCRDVVKEARNESRADHGMNTLLYSSHLHKTFQSAYEKGLKESQEENKKQAGYGEGAIVVHKRAKPNGYFR